jgi:hypothetical protein
MIFQVLCLSLVAFSFGLRIINAAGERLRADDTKSVVSSDAIPRVALNRGSKSLPGDVRAYLLGTKVCQSVQRNGVPVTPMLHATTPCASPLVGSLLIRAPPSLANL